MPGAKRWIPISAKNVNAVVIVKQVRGQQQNFRLELEKKKATRDADRADEQTVDDVQPRKIMGSRRHFVASRDRVASVAGGMSEGAGRSQLSG
jgi:hypothetical protein